MCSSVSAGRVRQRAARFHVPRRRPARGAARAPASPPARASARAPVCELRGHKNCYTYSYIYRVRAFSRNIRVALVKDQKPEWLREDLREWTNGASTVALAERHSRAARSSVQPVRRVAPTLI